MKVIRNFLWCTLITVSAQAYIYEIRVVRGWDETQARYQYLIGLSDFHDKIDAANKTQMDTLKAAFTQCCSRDPKIIVEDISSKGSQGRMCCGNFFVESHGGILGGLTEICKSCGVKDVDNIEYRYCRVTSLGPIINNLNGSLDSFPSSKAITIGSLLEEIDMFIAELTTFAQGGIVNNYYKTSVAQLFQEIAALQLRDHKEMSVADYIATHEKDAGRLALIRKLLTFDSTLLDVKMLHMLATCVGKDTVIAVAGGAHIGRVWDVLEQAGYERVYATNIKMMKETDPAKCVGCTMTDKNCCLKPEPIDISPINQFI